MFTAPNKHLYFLIADNNNDCCKTYCIIRYTFICNDINDWIKSLHEYIYLQHIFIFLSREHIGTFNHFYLQFIQRAGRLKTDTLFGDIL